MPQIHELPERIIAKVLREVLARERFSSTPDLVQALKCRLGQLRIGWTPADLDRALRLVESNRALVRPPWPRAVPPPLPPPPPIIGREEAARLLAALARATGRTLPVRGMR